MVAGPIRIIYDGRLPGNDGETLVVEKPGSMPVRSSASLTRLGADLRVSQVHSTGRYNFNTLLSILKYDYDLPLVHSESHPRSHWLSAHPLHSQPQIDWIV